MLNWLKESIKKNHFAQMAICCTLPVILIVVLQFAGFNSVWLYPLALAVCVGSHLVMMYFNAKEGKACH